MTAPVWTSHCSDQARCLHVPRPVSHHLLPTSYIGHAGRTVWNEPLITLCLDNYHIHYLYVGIVRRDRY
jgi:hypothetical protein